MNWYKTAIDANGLITLYRGLGQEIDSEHDLTTTDAPTGYSTWTDNPELARQYAGNKGNIYKIDLPRRELGNSYIDDEGERALFFNNEKPAGLNNVFGDEYLIYHDHELFNPSLIQLYSGAI